MSNDNLHLNQHISQRYNEELEGLRSKVLEMGGIVEKQVIDGTQALIESDADLGHRVVEADIKVNTLEVEMDEACVDILARRQPAASDLRLVFSIIKTITDLERIGDQAEKLGVFAMELSEQGVAAEHYVSLENISEKSLRVLSQALDAFARLDVKSALKAAKKDRKVDKEYDALTRQLITYMMEDPREIKSVLHVMWAARAFERIGDHAKNIAEYVVYLVKGKDIRHLEGLPKAKEL